MKKLLKEVFKVKIPNAEGGDGETEVSLAVLPPSAAIKTQGRIVHAKAYNEAVQGGAMLREELEGHLKHSKLWDEERQAEYERLRKILLDGERRLAKGGMKLKEARNLAISMSKARMDLQDLLAQRNRVDADTADSIADQAQFNYFVAACTVYNETGKPFFTRDGEHPSVDDYIEKAGEPAAQEAAAKLSEVMVGGEREKEIIAKLPENLFLKRFGMVDEEFHLVNAEGKRVDDQGRLVDKEGRFINEQGEYVDADGHRVDKEGRYVVEEEPFLDDDGKPIVNLPAPTVGAALPTPPTPPLPEKKPEKKSEKKPEPEPVVATATTD